MAKVLTSNGYLEDESDWDLSTAKANCRDCYGRGFLGIRREGDQGTKVLCHCVRRRKREEAADAGKAVLQ